MGGRNIRLMAPSVSFPGIALQMPGLPMTHKDGCHFDRFIALQNQKNGLDNLGQILFICC